MKQYVLSSSSTDHHEKGQDTRFEQILVDVISDGVAVDETHDDAVPVHVHIPDEGRLDSCLHAAHHTSRFLAVRQRSDSHLHKPSVADGRIQEGMSIRLPDSLLHKDLLSQERSLVQSLRVGRVIKNNAFGALSDQLEGRPVEWNVHRCSGCHDERMSDASPTNNPHYHN